MLLVKPIQHEGLGKNPNISKRDFRSSSSLPVGDVMPQCMLSKVTDNLGSEKLPNPLAPRVQPAKGSSRISPGLEDKWEEMLQAGRRQPANLG